MARVLKTWISIYLSPAEFPLAPIDFTVCTEVKNEGLLGEIKRTCTNVRFELGAHPCELKSHLTKDWMTFEISLSQNLIMDLPHLFFFFKFFFLFLMSVSVERSKLISRLLTYSQIKKHWDHAVGWDGTALANNHNLELKEAWWMFFLLNFHSIFLNSQIFKPKDISTHSFKQCNMPLINFLPFFSF